MRLLQSGAIFSEKEFGSSNIHASSESILWATFMTAKSAPRNGDLNLLKNMATPSTFILEGGVFNGVIIRKTTLNIPNPTDWMAQTFFGVAKNAANVTCVAKMPFCRRSRRQVLLPKEGRTCTPYESRGNCLKASSLVRTL
ncbi:hypothetical protein CDAR_21931 [Caerostris darwini]|uniref:Uncharacterized protein n=1 Tax=Caerostris darwini TaxID=1538125 RepID=A0AAV4VXL1_9ARAC|nr:hypothetical protein CDAR_21931 [Caerostris darwini]